MSQSHILHHAVRLTSAKSALNSLASTEPLSREDALSQRLKTLRGRQQHNDTLKKPVSAPPPNDPPPPYSGPPDVSASSAAAAGFATGEDPVADEEDADRTLDEILDSLVLDDDDHWSVSDDDGAGEEDDSKRVEDLLARLTVAADTQPPHGSHDDGDDDDSDGEVMSKQVDDVLSQTKDGLKLDESSAVEDKKPPDPVTDTTTVPPDTDKDTEEGGLTLPTVPTHIQPPPPPTNTSNTSNDPFESSIAARLAALGHNPVATDDFGLPSAPTFQPADRPVAGVVRKPGGYTDDDQKTWCIVCLENATVRCLGCDGDVFCARCWREMHVGPAAGYDERGHAWEKFDARRL